MIEKEFSVEEYDFTSELFDKLQDNYFAQNCWPLVYILHDDKKKIAYIGETTDVLSRMSAHLKHPDKKKLVLVNLIMSDKFNKSSALDIEANLIKYMAAEGRYRLLNANLGIANHNYYQKQSFYWPLFTTIWDSLRSKGITLESLNSINNSDLFKYSPYKTLTKEQLMGLFRMVEALHHKDKKCVLVEGGAGTGKTVLAVFLFKLLCTTQDELELVDYGESDASFIRMVKEIKDRYDNLTIGLVVPMSSLRKTLKKVFANINGLKGKMVIGPSEVAKQKYDILIVDESHRLRQRRNLVNYSAFDKVCTKMGLDKKACSEVDWIIAQSKTSIFFYDADQSIKPTDAPKEVFQNIKAKTDTICTKLISQFRVRGGNAYVDFISRLLQVGLSKNHPPYSYKEYELFLYESLEEMVNTIKNRDSTFGLSRLIAGYSWEWKSDKNPEAYDIEIDGISLRWNQKSIDWINSENAVHEVGCIHTTQGYDLNYAGVIFGKEITYNKTTNSIEVIESNYFDKNGKQSIKNPEQLKTFILNIYKTILLRGIKGTYVYVCDPDLRDYLKQFIIVKDSKPKAIPVLNESDFTPFINCIPLYDLSAVAGGFSNEQTVKHAEWVAYEHLQKGPIEDFFACRVIGESMNMVIPHNSICVFRKERGGSRNGKIVLVENTNQYDVDFGSYYTVKEYHSKKYTSEEGWKHLEIKLKPLSTDEKYKEIILDDCSDGSFRVIGEFVKVLG